MHFPYGSLHPIHVGHYPDHDYTVVAIHIVIHNYHHVGPLIHVHRVYNSLGYGWYCKHYAYDVVVMLWMTWDLHVLHENLLIDPVYYNIHPMYTMVWRTWM